MSTFVNATNREFVSYDPNVKMRYYQLNNIALDGFYIGSGKTNTLNEVCRTLVIYDWIDMGRLVGSNMRLFSKHGVIATHFCIVCDDVYATCSIPHKKFLIDGESFIKHNTKSFLELSRAHEGEDYKFSTEYINKKISAQNSMNAAYRQLINCSLNEVFTRYGKVISKNPLNASHIIMLYSREINYAQVQFTLAATIPPQPVITDATLNMIYNNTNANKGCNYGQIKKLLLIHYDKCHQFYTRGFEDREKYAKWCFDNIHKRGREFETKRYHSFDDFNYTFRFGLDHEEAQKLLDKIYRLEKYKYEKVWFHEDGAEKSLLGVNQTKNLIVTRIMKEIIDLTF